MADALLEEMRAQAHSVHINSRGHCRCLCPKCFNPDVLKPCVCPECTCEWAREANA
jgi:hypothetical protein